MHWSGKREGGAAGGLPFPVARARDGGFGTAVAEWTVEFRIAAWVTLSDVLAVGGISIVRLFRADVVSPAGSLRDPTCLAPAMHAAGPGLALAAASIVAVRVGSPAALTALGAVAGLTQGLDAAAAAVRGDMAGTLVPACLTALQCWALVQLNAPPLPRAAGRS